VIAGQPYLRRVASAASRRVSAALRRRRPRQVFGALGVRLAPVGTRLPMGASFPSGHAPDAPMIVIVAVGLDEETVRSSLRLLADIQLATASFRPLVISDMSTLEPARELGWSSERILSGPEYALTTGRSDWSTYLGARVSDVVDSYGATAVLPVPASGFAAADRESLLTLAATPR
jgi:hypothetical protein